MRCPHLSESEPLPDRRSLELPAFGGLFPSADAQSSNCNPPFFQKAGAFQVAAPTWKETKQRARAKKIQAQLGGTSLPAKDGIPMKQEIAHWPPLVSREWWNCWATPSCFFWTLWTEMCMGGVGSMCLTADQSIRLSVPFKEAWKPTLQANTGLTPISRPLLFLLSSLSRYCPLVRRVDHQRSFPFYCALLFLCCSLRRAWLCF
ncbi:uncharacterized protein B0H64DRAFT_178711 [Chaetomium fimeti]|uniref:Uncharacterized protein n=1 Tax=Chaetomium fimeti TaxID=1854472 RepID=A0AAE0HCJ9_9PEZI|nr:hypothetical protein B0H64DRAFT_178711 [Chaetomium fimeti]